MAEKPATPEEIQRLEAVAAAVWSPARIEEVDGWLLYESGGGTRRSQSVQTTRWQGAEVGASIEACEQVYAECGASCVFKMTAASEPSGLDAALERRGYARRDETIVQTASIDAAECSERCIVEPTSSDAWLACWLELTMASVRDTRAHAETLQRMAARDGPTAFVSIPAGDGIAAIGLGAVEDDACFVGEVATLPGHRRSGHGREIVRGIMGWARGQGARRALLQVVATNEQARRMYAGLGFSDRYLYWYREQVP